MVEASTQDRDGSGAAGGRRGYDGGKTIIVRKCQPLVDTKGIFLKVKVHPADNHDCCGGELLLTSLSSLFSLICLLWAATAYQGLKEWGRTTRGWTLTITKLAACRT
jgi:hypothetical protein